MGFRWIDMKRAIAEYEAGDTIAEIAKRYGVSASVMSRRFKYVGVKVRSKRGVPPGRKNAAVQNHAR